MKLKTKLIPAEQISSMISRFRKGKKHLKISFNFNGVTTKDLRQKK